MRHAVLFYIIFGLSILSAQAQQATPARNSSHAFAFPEGNLIETRNEVRLFPNPATEYLIVEINDPQLTEVGFELNNIIGDRYALRADQLGGNRYKIFVNDLPSGYYFLTIKDRNTPYKRAYRFVKK